jgi:hypothetical protein
VTAAHPSRQVIGSSRASRGEGKNGYAGRPSMHAHLLSSYFIDSKIVNYITVQRCPGCIYKTCQSKSCGSSFEIFAEKRHDVSNSTKLFCRSHPTHPSAKSLRRLFAFRPQASFKKKGASRKNKWTCPACGLLNESGELPPRIVLGNSARGGGNGTHAEFYCEDFVQ